ncbi:glycosyltransferase family 34 protein [Aulographum hederae CBS 113979]|uniref:Glycosyltransferase family 34 protein n=1 Tax=Aulographum hederae CBS 113979 TaxID=1176131 RepID=A0A6G1GZE3_9PEZI|nr:glycosyltransferase family 34 protein [Aulographum hederae CBS 113979]
MSLSRSPSPQRGGGWSSPGLNTPYNSGSRRSSPMRAYSNGATNNVTWASAQAKSAEVKGYPAFQTRNQGIFARYARKVSSGMGLPMFAGANNKDYAEKEKLGRGRWASGGRPSITNLLRIIGNNLRRGKLVVLIPFCMVCGFLLYILFILTPLNRLYNRSTYGRGGSKFVIILAANQGGGVMEWKGPREWAIERDSVRNKKKYVQKWGYELDIVDMSTKKKYAHEWRENWEKVDLIRAAMRKYPTAEWFWWLDLNTFIMEPTYSLQSHIFNNLPANTYRDINDYNPLNISHPLTYPYLDPISLSPVGDNKPDSINLIVPQDCGGFNLGSFFVRRSVWTDRLLDIWWDPVGYEQKHMEWEHKEQDALEYMYRNQPWVRPHVAFIPQRKVNSFPPGACNDGGENPRFHYKEQDRDFLVNMAGCEWGRDCWGEMYNYRQLSNRLNRGRWERFKDGVSDYFRKRREETQKRKEEEERRKKEGQGQQQG